MTRTHYRLALSLICSLAALVGPVVFLEDRLRLGYWGGGFVAALLAWAFLAGVVAIEPRLSPGLQGVIGTGAAALSWVSISLVTLFDVIPHIARHGLGRFDPVWLMAGFAPLVVGGTALWLSVRRGVPLWRGVLSGLYRFSTPLFGLVLVTRVFNLPKQFRWLYLFTGVMFLVLDGLGLDEKPVATDPEQ